MAIIKQYHKESNTTYVYESTSYWDSEKQQSRSKRKLLGKLDPVTGEIVPTGKRGRKKKEAAFSTTDLSQTTKSSEDQEKISELLRNISQRDARIALLEKENKDLRAALAKISGYLSQCECLCSGISEEGRR